MSFELPAKDPDIDTLYDLDIRKFVTEVIRRDHPYAVNDLTKPHFGIGFYLLCTTAGETAEHHPDRYPRAAELTLQDGSVVWTLKHPSASNLPAITSAVWTFSDPALTLDSQTFEGGLLRPVFVGGADGVTYEATARVTWNNTQVEDVTFLIPVEHQ